MTDEPKPAVLVETMEDFERLCPEATPVMRFFARAYFNGERTPLVQERAVTVDVRCIDGSVVTTRARG